jgi:hypothetical protein
MGMYMRKLGRAASESIHPLIEAYKQRLKAPQGTVLDAVCRAYSTLGIFCTTSDLAYNVPSKTIFIRVHGPQKTEMLLTKSQVLTALRSQLRDADIPKDIV